LTIWFLVFRQFDFDVDALENNTVRQPLNTNENSISEFQADINDDILTSFDDFKKRMVENIDKLRPIWNTDPEIVIMMARYFELADQIGPDFLPLIMFCEAVKSKSAQFHKEATPCVSRITSLYLSYGYR